MIVNALYKVTACRLSVINFISYKVYIMLLIAFMFIREIKVIIEHHDISSEAETETVPSNQVEEEAGVKLDTAVTVMISA